MTDRTRSHEGRTERGAAERGAAERGAHASTTDTASTQPASTHPAPTHPASTASPTKHRTSAAATFALVLGLIGFLAAITGLLAPVAVMAGLIGLILGIVGVRAANKPHLTGKGVAISGLVLSILALLLGLAAIIGVATIVSSNPQVLDQITNLVNNARSQLPTP